MKTRLKTCTKRRLALQGLAVCAALGLTQAAAAQDGRPTVKPSKMQIDLNQRGFEASKAKDYDTAVAAFKTSIGVGELNVTYLNLGRAHHKAGQCWQAEEAYKNALTSPIADVRTPSPDEVQTYVDNFRAELRETCPGSLVIRCTPADMTVTIDDEDAQPCPSEPIDLPPGNTIVRGELWDWTASETIKIKALTHHTVELTLQATGDQLQARTLFQSGLTAQTAGRKGDAERAFKEAALRDPTWPAPRRRLAAIALDADDLDAAAKHTGLLLQIAPEADRPEIAKNLDNIKNQIDARKASQIKKNPTPDPNEGTTKPKARDLSGVWWLLGAAAASGAGVALDTVPDSTRNFEMDALDIAPLGLYAGGLVFGVIGLVELFDAESPAEHP